MEITYTDPPSQPVIEFVDEPLVKADELESGMTLRMKCTTEGGNPAPSVSLLY